LNGSRCVKSQLFKTAGNRIFLPQAMREIKTTAYVFDLQGRLLFSKSVIDQNSIDLARKNVAGKVLIVKVRALY
jgi:hypothetical protein